MLTRHDIFLEVLGNQVEECECLALNEILIILEGLMGGNTNYARKAYAWGLEANKEVFHII